MPVSQNPQNLRRWTDERQISDADAELIANHMVDKLVTRLSDETTVNALVGVWTKQLDGHIGRAFRRMVWLLITAVSIFVAVRMEAVLAWIKR